LYQHTMYVMGLYISIVLISVNIIIQCQCHNMSVNYVIRLSNISIKTNFKQITRVELKLTNLQNALKTATFCE
jgi:hypothetical protein